MKSKGDLTAHSFKVDAAVACAVRTVAYPSLFVRMAHATKVRTVEHLERIFWGLIEHEDPSTVGLGKDTGESLLGDFSK